MEGRSALGRQDPAKPLKTNRALSSAPERPAALPAGVTCLWLPMPQASFLAFARSCDLDPDGDSLRHSDAAAERQPYAVAVVAIDAIERRIDGVDGGVPRGHEITCALCTRAASCSVRCRQFVLVDQPWASTRCLMLS